LKNNTKQPIEIDFMVQKWKWKMKTRRTYVVEAMGGKNTPLGR